MSVTMEVKEKTFEKELELIYDVSIREFTKLCICSAPDYFFTDCPASSSGKYHPVDELGADGTILHTKKVFTVAYDLSRGLGCEDNRDEVLSACIIHDLRKQGVEKTGYTVKNHPDLGAQLVHEVHQATQMIDKRTADMIRGCVGYHYGPWSIAPWKKDLSHYTPEELCVYLSDYIASKRMIHVDHRR